MDDTEHKSHRFSKERIVIISLAVVALALLGGLGALYAKYNQVKNDPNTAQAAQKKQNDALLVKVGKLIAIPADETPIIATVSDKTKLKDQPFFKDAENGDKILMYAQAKKAIVYRESTNQLINVGPIAITSDSASTAAPAGTTTQSTTPTKK